VHGRRSLDRPGPDHDLGGLRRRSGPQAEQQQRGLLRRHGGTVQPSEGAAALHCSASDGQDARARSQRSRQGPLQARQSHEPKTRRGHKPPDLVVGSTKPGAGAKLANDGKIAVKLVAAPVKKRKR
jgi:hypothetical protein